MSGTPSSDSLRLCEWLLWSGTNVCNGLAARGSRQVESAAITRRSRQGLKPARSNETRGSVQQTSRLFRFECQRREWPAYFSGFERSLEFVLLRGCVKPARLEAQSRNSACVLQRATTQGLARSSKCGRSGNRVPGDLLRMWSSSHRMLMNFTNVPAQPPSFTFTARSPMRRATLGPDGQSGHSPNR